MHILWNFNYPCLLVASYGANRSCITYSQQRTFESIIFWPPSRTLGIKSSKFLSILHDRVPNAYVSVSFHIFCCILNSAVLSPTSVAALPLHSTAILEVSSSLLYPVYLVCMHNISFPATIFCTATDQHVVREHPAAPPARFCTQTCRHY